MADKYLIYKNALIATMDEQSRAGVFNLIIKNDKIYDIDFDNRLNNEEVIIKLYPKSEIIDFKNKLIAPLFVNSHFCSSYSLCSVFFRRHNYDTLPNNISLMLLNKYFKTPKVKNDLKNLLKINYSRALSNGEIILNETSSFITKEFLFDDKFTSIPYGQEIVFTSHDGYLNSYLWNNNKFHFITLKYNEEVNNYSLSFLKKSYSREKNKIFLENLKSAKNSGDITRNFGKSFIKVLNDNDLLSPDLILSNPVHLSTNDFEILSEKKVNVVLCPSDLRNLASENINLSDFFNSGINVCIGTGYLGENVLSELKKLSGLINLNDVTYDMLYRTITTNPLKIFDRTGYSNIIEKGGYADFIVFDLSDIRNSYDFPEYDLNFVARHIIESLDTKDISDIIFRGNHIVKDYQSKFYEQEFLRKNIKELTANIYDTGKYFELKEKYLMKKRIKKLSSWEKEKAEFSGENDSGSAYEDELAENPKMIQDSEFKVIGAKINEQLIMSSDIISPDDNIFKNISEISSLDFGLSVFGNEDKITDKPDKILENEKTPVKEPAIIDKSKLEKIYFDDVKNSPEAEKSGKPEKTGHKHHSQKGTKFIKSKLKFGFSDEDKNQ